MAKKKKPNPSDTSVPLELVCDPSVCDECQYIGGGDFICTQGEPVVVIDEWNPTENYLICCQNSAN